MTVDELIQRLNQYPRDLEVGGSDDMGQIEQITSVSLRENTGLFASIPAFVCIEIEEGWKESPYL